LNLTIQGLLVYQEESIPPTSALFPVLLLENKRTWLSLPPDGEGRAIQKEEPLPPGRATTLEKREITEHATSPPERLSGLAGDSHPT
jgi:hypothetical protein